MPLDQVRLDQVATLSRGIHKPGPKMSLLEAVAYAADLPWSASPDSVSPTLAEFGNAWNDGMRSDRERDQLKQYIPLLFDTAGDVELERRRSFMALNWLVRTYCSTWLRLAGLDELSKDLARLPEVKDTQAALTRIRFVDTAGNATWAVAGAVARDAAWGAAGLAVRRVAGDAAWTATGAAAGVAAWAASRYGASAGVWQKAWDASWADADYATPSIALELEPTIKELQASAHALYHRMIEDS